MADFFWTTISTKGWTSTPPPWRLSFFDILFFIYYILRFSFFKKRPRVLVVGATKEIREILSKLAIRYDLVDFSNNMISVTKPAHTDSVKNIFLMDWRQFTPEESEYDLVLGDLILSLLEKEEVRRLSHTLVSGLRKKGKIIFRTRTVDTNINANAISMVRKQLKKMHSADNYTAYANLQTLEKIFSLNAIQIVEAELSSISGKGNTSSLLSLKKNFLQSTLKYYLYSMSELESLMTDLSIKFKHSYTPKGYLDTFSFLVVSKLN